MKKSFDLLGAVLTVLLSAVGAYACIVFYDEILSLPFGRLLWTGIFLAVPFIMGKTGICISLKLRSGKREGEGKKRPLSVILGIVAAFILGAGGQALYSFTLPEREKEPPQLEFIFLLDGSSSMSDYQDSVKTAACSLVDQMNENHFVQLICFESRVYEHDTELLMMDDAGKAQIKEAINAQDTQGGTNFDLVLQDAVATLKKSERGLPQAILFLTDGEDDISEETKQMFDKITVYPIRIAEEDSTDEDVLDLVAFAKSTGGFDTIIKVKRQEIDEKALKAAFESVFYDVQEKAESGEKFLLYGSESFHALRLLLRVVVFVLYSMLVAWVYYHTVSMRAFIGNAAAGIALSAAVMFIDETGLLMVAVYALLVWGAYTLILKKQEESFDV